MAKIVKREHNYCYLNKEERIIEIKKILKQEIEQQDHLSRNRTKRIDCDTSIIDMDISPVCLERKPIMNVVSFERIKNAIKSSPLNNKKMIFVGNISKYYSKHYLHKLFTRFGPIRNLKIYGKRYR